MFTLAAADTIQAVAGTTTAITYSIFGMELASGVETYKRLSQGQVATSAAAIYTVPGSTQAFVKLIVLANATGSAVSGVILYSGGTAAANQITGSLTIPANGVATLNDLGLQITDASGNLYTTGTNSFGSTIGQDTTPLVDGAAGTATLAARNDHVHRSPGGIASISAASSGINNTETAVISATIPASLLRVGTTFRLWAAGTGTTTVANSNSFRVRLGTAGSSSDAALCTLTVTAGTTGSGIVFVCEFIATIRSIGSGGTGLAGGWMTNASSTGLNNAGSGTQSQVQPSATQTVNTTVQNIIQLSYVSAATTTTATFYQASIEIIKM